MSFKFKANFAGVSVPGQRVPAGLYRCVYGADTVLDKRNAKTGCTTVQVDFAVTDGDHRGGFIRTFVRLPDSDHADNDKAAKANVNAVSQWKLMLLSAGVPASELEKELVISDETLKKGRVFHIDYIPKDEAMGRAFDEVKFLTPEQYALRTGGEVDAPPPAAAEPVKAAPKARKAKVAEPEDDGLAELLGDV